MFLRSFTELALPRPVLGKTVRTFRKLNNINVNSLYLDISNSSISELDNEADVNILAQILQDTLVELLDKHAPIVTKKITDRPNLPWYGEELRMIKVNKRRWEIIYTKSKLCKHKQIYQETCSLYRIKLEKSKEEYFRSKVLEADPMVFFKVIDKLFRTTSKPILPSLSTAGELAIKFSNCFVEKIQNLRDEIAENNSLLCLLMWHFNVFQFLNRLLMLAVTKLKP